jgi:hypothetical protein
MARLLIQSLATGMFLAPDDLGQPDWVMSLRDAAGGVCSDVERVHQLIDDWCDFDDQPVCIDLDCLGTSNDSQVSLGPK